MYSFSEIIRVYRKAPGKQPDQTAPFLPAKESAMGDLAAKIYKDFVNMVKLARIQGTAIHGGRSVQNDYVPQDGDAVEMHI